MKTHRFLLKDWLANGTNIFSFKHEEDVRTWNGTVRGIDPDSEERSEKHCVQRGPRLRPTRTYTQFAKVCIALAS